MSAGEQAPVETGSCQQSFGKPTKVFPEITVPCSSVRPQVSSASQEGTPVRSLAAARSDSSRLQRSPGSGGAHLCDGVDPDGCMASIVLRGVHDHIVPDGHIAGVGHVYGGPLRSEAGLGCRSSSSSGAACVPPLLARPEAHQLSLDQVACDGDLVLHVACRCELLLTCRGRGAAAAPAPAHRPGQDQLGSPA